MKDLISFFPADFEQMDKYYRTHFFNSLTGFKSLTLVGTQNEKAQTNLAVFSQVIHLGADPAMIGILVRPASVPRHTLENINKIGFFTLNHVKESFVKKAHQTSARYAEDISEFDAVGLTPFYSENIKAPYVKEADIRIGLKAVEQLLIQSNKTILIAGEIIEVMLPQEIVKSDGFIDLNEAGSLTVTGLDAYLSTSKIARFSYAKPEKPLENLDY
jgi:flavin reductase (DIM6/NTAB) family NADH-FMN oxidoreductase RutF